MNTMIKAILKHLSFWALYSVYQLTSNNWQNKDELHFTIDRANISYLAVVVMLTYINYYLLMPKYADSKKYFKYFLTVTILILIGATIQRFLTYAIWTPWDKQYNPYAYLNEPKAFFIPIRILRNSFRIFPVIAITALVGYMKRAYEMELKLRTTEEEKHNVETNYLKSQINPHFFFNTLNSLYALSNKGSALTSSLILQLSEFMQFMVYQSAQPNVSLDDELAHLERYIAIEKIRFEDFGEIELSFPENCANVKLAPLLLMPFVENAFKHGIPDKSGWIRITLTVSEDQLCYNVINNFTDNGSAKAKGIGLENLTKRLEIYYPGRYKVSCTNQNEIFNARLLLEI